VLKNTVIYEHSVLSTRPSHKPDAPPLKPLEKLFAAVPQKSFPSIRTAGCQSFRKPLECYDWTLYSGFVSRISGQAPLIHRPTILVSSEASRATPVGQSNDLHFIRPTHHGVADTECHCLHPRTAKFLLPTTTTVQYW
jgi:hypothetical protein